MFRLALKSTLARKLRLISTGLAVTLGIAFLAGTLVFTDTIKRTFDDLFADIYAETDAYVRSTKSIEMDFGGEVTAYDFKRGTAEALGPAGKQKAALPSRETVYLPQADLMLIEGK